ncbi:MAG: DEAD/DEAH box helicase [archaeon]
MSELKEISKFSELSLKPEILQALRALEFEDTFPIQAKGLPPALAGRDLVAKAQTGTGKTAVFGLSILNRLPAGSRGIFALIIVPTRELAVQVADEISSYSTEPPQTVAAYGGVSIEPQIDKLRRASIVVGTPGRLLDHISRGTINLSNVKVLVLDEVDRMLDMGFIEDIEQIVSRVPRERQTMFFSATIPDKIRYLAERFLNNPIDVSVGGAPTAEGVSQFYVDSAEGNKPGQIFKLLSKTPETTLVFCRTREKTQAVGTFLKKHGIPAESIHGNLTQAQRERTMQLFKEGNLQVMVATDVAARGLDIDGVSTVVNYDFPDDLDTYIHRIGRTARAGKEGRAITFVVHDNHLTFRKLMDLMGGKIEKLEIPLLPGENFRLEFQHRQRPGGRFGGRRGPQSNRRGGSFGRGRTTSR